MRIPGEAASVMTCIDGYAMAQKGRAGAALASPPSARSSRARFGVIGLTLVAPPLAEFALRFGPPEYTALLLLGLIFLAYMSSSSLVRTLLMAAFGLLLGTIGIDVMSGHFRYSFDIDELGDGIGIVPVAVGLFGLGEILSNAEHGCHRRRDPPEAPRTPAEPRGMAPVGPADRARHRAGLPDRHRAGLGAHHLELPLLRGRAAHLEAPGAIRPGRRGGRRGPGIGQQRRLHRRLRPMLALGIPTGPVTAVLIAALLLHGIPPGPTLVNDQPELFWGFVASMYVGNLMLLALNLPLVGLFVNLLRIPYCYLYPLIIMFCIIGVYGVNNSIVDVWIMLIMGAVGYLLRKLDFDPAPLVLGLVIAPTFELSLRQSLVMSSGDWMIFLQRPIAAALFASSAICSCSRPLRCARAGIGAPGWSRSKPRRRADQRRRRVEPDFRRRLDLDQHLRRHHSGENQSIGRPRGIAMLADNRREPLEILLARHENQDPHQIGQA